MTDIYVGIDLGGTNVKVGCFDEKLNVLNKTSVPTQCDMGPDFVVDKIVEAVTLSLTGISAEIKDVTALGIGAPGPSNLSEGIIIAAPNMPKFKNVPMRDILSNAYSRHLDLHKCRPGVNIACSPPPDTDAATA